MFRTTLPSHIPASKNTAEQRTIIQQYGPLMSGLLDLVQQGGAWAGCSPFQSPPCCTKCNTPPIDGQCTNHIIRCGTITASELQWVNSTLKHRITVAAGPQTLVTASGVPGAEAL